MGAIDRFQYITTSKHFSILIITKYLLYTVEVLISNQTELEAEGRAVEQLFSDSVS